MKNQKKMVQHLPIFYEGRMPDLFVEGIEKDAAEGGKDENDEPKEFLKEYLLIYQLKKKQN